MKPRHIHLGSLISRGTTLGMKNIFRNKFLSLATITVLAIILFIFNIILTVNFTSKNLITQATQKIDLVIYLRNDIEDLEAQTMLKEINQIPQVTNATFRSKEEALDIIRQTSPETVALLERNEISNPLPADIKIITNSIEDHNTVLSIIQKRYQDKVHPLFHNLLSQKTDQVLKIAQENQKLFDKVSTNIIKFTNITNQIIFWTIFIFIIGGLLIMMNAIQLTIYNRQKEIEVMKLVGATHNFIRLPYVFEGIVYGISAVIVSIVLMTALSFAIDTTIFSTLSNQQIFSIIVIELLSTITLGAFSSIITVNRYLK